MTRRLYFPTEFLACNKTLPRFGGSTRNRCLGCGINLTVFLILGFPKPGNG